MPQQLVRLQRPFPVILSFFPSRSFGSSKRTEAPSSAAEMAAIIPAGPPPITNCCGIDEFLDSVPRNGRFLYSAYSQFGSGAAMAFFEELGVPLKVERGTKRTGSSGR